ncbi:MAG: HEAT repeat domain-containing protein [Planctomycetota bacterium]
MRRCLIVLLAASCLFADDAARPKVFFRSPDKATEKRIEVELLRGDGIGAGTVDRRALARAELEVLDAWAVPYLVRALAGRRADGAHTVRMNAAATLARILDPRALPALRTAAVKDKDRWVRRTATLGLGLFEEPTDVVLFAGMLDRKPIKRRDAAAALALGKINSPTATNALRARLVKPPDDKHLIAGKLLACSIRTADAPIDAYLRHKDRLVQRVAAACLQVRPLAPADAPRLLKVIERCRYREVRALLFDALARIEGRTPFIRAALIDCAVKKKYKAEARIAALNGLAYEWNERSSFDRLNKFYRSIRGRNDPVLAALMFAMVRTGHPEAVDTMLRVLRTGSPFVRFYATASLFHLVALGPEKHPREGEITSAIAQQRSRSQDAQLLALIDLVGRWQLQPEEVQDRRKLAREGFARIGDPKDLHLFDRTREDRAWVIVNRMVPLILDLDELLGANANPETGEKPQPKPGSDGKNERGTEEELDLLSFLEERPYYVPEDLG